MFEKFLNEYTKNVRHIDQRLAPIEQLKLALKEGLDYMWLENKRISITEADAKLILRHYRDLDRNRRHDLQETISTERGLRDFVSKCRQELREAKQNQERQLKESVSEMFELVRNLKYVPGLEKVLTVNNTIDGMEATVLTVGSTQYHVRITPISGHIAEGFEDRKWYKDYDMWNRARRNVPVDNDDMTSSRYEGKLVASWSERDGEGWVRDDKKVSEELRAVGGDHDKQAAVEAMRKAAVTMVSMGIGRDEEKARLQVQTIGLNYGLKPQEAAELARKILADEMGDRRRRLG